MYMTFVVQNMKEKFETNNELTFPQKAKLLGLISYYSTQIGNIDNTYAYSFFPMLSGKNYDDEFRKNKYYNIADFKEVYEDTRTGGIDIDNWVQPDFSSKENKSLPTEELIILYSRPDLNSFSQEIKPKNPIEYMYTVSGLDFIKVDGSVGYLPSAEAKEAYALEQKEKRKRSFLAEDDEEIEPKRKKGFWGDLFG